MPRRVLLLMPATTYKAAAFLEAAACLDVQVVVGTDRHQALERRAPRGSVTLDLRRPERAVERILALHADAPLHGIVGTDDETVELAARAATTLGLPCNPVGAVRAARDKFQTRARLHAAGLDQPAHRRVALPARPEAVATAVRYPCVLKPPCLAASRGVLRADDPAGFVRAFRRVAAILAGADVAGPGADRRHLVVEDFRSGPEFVLEGLLAAGRLHVLALLDKPDPLEGPTFQETVFVTPSRLPVELQQALAAEARAGCAALGLVEGPVHAELRLHGERPWIVEIAPRTIGGLCSRALRFGAGVTLEELILRHAVGRPTQMPRESAAAGVMMIPVPRAGRLRRVGGLAAARAVEGIEQVTISAHRGARIEPLPEGHRYLGFIFARAGRPEEAEAALRRAHALLDFVIDETDEAT